MKKTDFSQNAPGKLIKTLQGYIAYIPKPLPPELSWSPTLINHLTNAERSIARLEEVGQSFPVPHVLARPFVRKEAVLSSQIEGTQTSFQNLLHYEAKQLTFLADAPDAHEVQNYVKALDYGLERIKTLPMSIRLIKELHEILMKGVRGELSTPGEIRRSQNWIGRPGATLENARYVPPPMDEMMNCLAALEKYLHQDSDLPALIRIGLIHYQFETIHPFLDGNGRIGRLIITLLLSTWQILTQPLLYLSIFIEKNKTEYYDRLLAVSLKGQWNEWLLFFLEGVHEQAEDAVVKISALQTVRGKYQQQFSNDRNREKLVAVVDYLISTPISSITQAQENTNLGSYTMIQRYFDKLLHYGVIEEMTGGRRNRIFQAREILRILEE
jgi:Fic family protein